MDGPGAYCPLDRYTIEDLTNRIVSAFPDLDPNFVSNFLTQRVNYAADEVPRNLPPEFTPENSISGFEAYNYIRTLLIGQTLEGESRESQIGRGLVDLFFAGDLSFRNVPPPAFIVFRKCHDGDTCTIVETQAPGCQFETAQTTVRVSGIDAPEVGSYYSRWQNKKFVAGVDRLRSEWIGKEDPPKSVLRDVNELIGLHIDYTGRLAGLIRNNLNTWCDTEGVPRIMRASIINWTWVDETEQVPPELCYTVQASDIYDRALGSFAQLYESYLERYLRERLAELMATEGKERYTRYRSRAMELIERLKRSGIERVAEFAKSFEDGLPDPMKIFSQERCDFIADAYHDLIGRRGPEYAADDQLLQIMIGSVYAYDKYRNQYSDIYQEANEFAMKNNVGFWSEATFRSIYEITERENPRFHPPRCP